MAVSLSQFRKESTFFISKFSIENILYHIALLLEQLTFLSKSLRLICSIAEWMHSFTNEPLNHRSALLSVVILIGASILKWQSP